MLVFLRVGQPSRRSEYICMIEYGSLKELYAHNFFFSFKLFLIVHTFYRSIHLKENRNITT